MSILHSPAAYVVWMFTFAVIAFVALAYQAWAAVGVATIGLGISAIGVVFTTALRPDREEVWEV